MEIPRRSIALFLIVSGIGSLAVTIDRLRGMTIKSATEIALLIAVVLLYLGMVVAGFLLFRKAKLAEWVAFWALAPQIPLFAFSRVTYAVTSMPTIEIKLWPRFGFVFSSMNYFSINFLPTTQDLYLGFNLIGLIAAGWIATQIQERDDRRRVKSVGTG